MFLRDGQVMQLGTTHTVQEMTVDDNKSVVANFRLVQYELALTMAVNGRGSIAETIINTGKTDYRLGD